MPRIREDVYLHTSKRMHFIEDGNWWTAVLSAGILAYVKTYALH